jgi:hypothetical protein
MERAKQSGGGTAAAGGIGHEQRSDARRKEALANPEVAADEADRVLADPGPGSREAEARGTNPDAEEEAAERLLEQTSSDPDDSPRTR